MSKNHTESSEQDNSLHNTKLLLHRLGDLRIHIQRSIHKAEQLDARNIKSLMKQGRDPDAFVNALLRSTTRTEILLVHAESMYNDWEAEGKTREEKRIRNIIRQRYFEKQELGDIMEREGKSKDYILGAMNNALNELSVRFFGADGDTRLWNDPAG